MEIQVIVAVIQVGPVEIQVNVVELHLSSVEIHVKIVEKQVSVFKINLYLDKNNLYITNTILYFNSSQLACRKIQIHVFSLLSINLFFRNSIACISTRRITWNIVNMIHLTTGVDKHVSCNETFPCNHYAHIHCTNAVPTSSLLGSVVCVVSEWSLRHGSHKLSSPPSSRPANV